MTDAPTVRQLLKDGIEAGRAGDVVTARAKLTQAVELDPTQADAWYLLAYFTNETGQKLTYLQRALDINPNHERARQLLDKIQPATPVEEDDPFADFPSAPPAPRPTGPDMTKTVRSAGGAGGAGGARRTGTGASGAGSNTAAQLGGLGKSFTEGLSGEKGRNLIRAWIAALSFDHNNSYEAYRGKADPVFTGVLMLLVFALVPVVTSFLSLVAQVGLRDLNFFVGGLLRTLVGSLLISAQLVFSLFLASYLSAYIARIQYKSDVSAQQHFALSGLFYVPAGIAFGVLSVVLFLVGLVLTRLLNFEGDLLVASATSYTIFVFFIYLLAQFVYSNAAIHRLNTWQAIVVSAVSALAASLVFVWLLPITLPLLNVA